MIWLDPICLLYGSRLNQFIKGSGTAASKRPHRPFKVQLEGGITSLWSWSLNCLTSRRRHCRSRTTVYVKVQYCMLRNQWLWTSPVSPCRARDTMTDWSIDNNSHVAYAGQLWVFLCSSSRKLWMFFWKTIQRAEIQYEYDLWKRLSIGFNCWFCWLESSIIFSES